MRLSMKFVSFAFAFAFATGCGGSSPARVTTTPAEPSPAAASDCPMDVAGTSVTVEDLAAGGALVFVTTGDAAAVRARVAGWVEAHNAHHSAMGPLPTGDETAPAGGHDHHHGGGAAEGGGETHAGHGGGQAGSFQTMSSAHSRASAVDIDGGVGSVRVIELIADAPGDWPLHCHMTHHVMNQMGHDVPNMIGADVRGLDPAIERLAPGYMTMGHTGMGEMSSMKMPLPKNTIAMVAAPGPFGPIDMGGMFTVLKVRARLDGDGDPGWYAHPAGTVASEASAADLRRDGIA